MVRASRLLLHLLSAVSLLAFGGCAMQAQWDEASKETVRQQDLAGFPYHPLVYHLDLCVLAYQLHAQSFVWPFDPYYEELNNWDWDRTRTIASVRDWAKDRGRRQVGDRTGVASYRGPGLLGGFADNPTHDPIIYRYDRLHPWSDTVAHSPGGWVEYRTPWEITGPVRDIFVCYRATGGSEGEVELVRLASHRRDTEGGARDTLLAFEGGTGDKGEPGQPASQSLMGFVLARHTAGGGYDVHIAFRGSRSGSVRRAFLQGISTGGAEGNPDWITDLGYRHLLPAEGGAPISTSGKVSRGFARGITSIFPQLFRCLERVARLQGGRAPERIYVTGHSLGGALAQHFVSAVLLGDLYGPGGMGKGMPASLRAWPWKAVKLVTFGAPRAGDAEWARTLTREALDSEVFSTAVDPYDRRALPVAHPSILPRITDRGRPSGYRVLLVQDLVATSKVVGGKHVGKSVYLDRPDLGHLVAFWSFAAHGTSEAREHMLGALDDPRIPARATRQLEMGDLNPGRDDARRGSVEEFRKLKRSVDRYYRDNGLWFDHQGFERDFRIYLSILHSR